LSDLRNSRITEKLAVYGLSTRFERLPAEVVDRAKRVIADEIGCMVLGSTIPPGIRMRSFVTSIGGVPEATIIGGGAKAPIGYAALANGTSAHADELDGVHLSQGHPGSLMVSAMIALCEGRSQSGRDLINALTLSYDVGCRMVLGMGGGAAIKQKRHEHCTPLFAQGIAVAAGRLLGLEQLAVQHAMSLAALCIAVPHSYLDERNHMSKAMNMGQCAYAGVTGALLAGHGFEAHDGFVEAKGGLIDGWRTDKLDLNVFTAGLGEEFSILQTGFKYYAAGYPIHSPLHGALELMREHAITTDRIARVRVGMAPKSADVVDGRRMASISLQSMMSLGMVLGRLTYDDAHDEAARNRADVQRLRNTIEIVRDESISADSSRRATWVEITTLSGQSHRGPERIAPGHWELGGMPWDDLRAKFDSLVGPRLGPEASKTAFSFIERLEQHDSLTDLCEAVSGRTR
jgi:2-methylcitrate dehydratase PrpD